MQWRPRHAGYPMTLALDRMRELWEFSPMSAKDIAARLRTTKNTVIGLAHRGGWEKHGERHPKASARAKEPTSTVFTRCDAWNAFMDRVLEETRPFVEDRPRVMRAVDKSGEDSVFDRLPGRHKTVCGTEAR